MFGNITTSTARFALAVGGIAVNLMPFASRDTSKRLDGKQSQPEVLEFHAHPQSFVSAAACSHNTVVYTERKRFRIHDVEIKPDVCINGYNIMSFTQYTTVNINTYNPIRFGDNLNNNKNNNKNYKYAIFMFAFDTIL